MIIYILHNYLENMRNSITFALKLMNNMNRLFTTYSIHNAVQENKILYGHCIVHVHWFSGFI